MALNQGDLCVVHYKSGRYIAQFVELSQNSSSKAVVKIVSVLEHPLQGDLHQPYVADVSMFHQRKASAYMEHILLPLHMIEEFDGEVLDYSVSLAKAWHNQLNELAHKEDNWSIKAREQLLLLKDEYGI